MSMNYEQLIDKRRYKSYLRCKWWPPADRLIKKKIIVCPRCEKNEAQLNEIYGVLNCIKCIEKDKKWNLEHPEYQGSYPKEGYNRKWEEKVNWQRENHRKEMIQPLDSKGRFNPEFQKAYGYNPFEKRKKQEITRQKTKEDRKLDKLAQIIERQKVKEIEDNIKLQQLPVNKNKHGSKKRF